MNIFCNKTNECLQFLKILLHSHFVVPVSSLVIFLNKLTRLRPIISFEKMADEKDAVDDGGKSFSFKFAKSKKNKTVISDKKINTFDVKVEETEDVDYVLATEGKEFKR